MGFLVLGLVHVVNIFKLRGFFESLNLLPYLVLMVLDEVVDLVLQLLLAQPPLLPKLWINIIIFLKSGWNFEWAEVFRTVVA